MPELSLRQLQARLEDLEEQHSKDVAELRALRREGAPAAAIEQQEAKVERTEEKAKTAEEEIADAKATLKRHGYELDEDVETEPLARSGEGEGAPEADSGDQEEKSVQEPPKPPKKEKPDVQPEPELHWSERNAW